VPDPLTIASSIAGRLAGMLVGPLVRRLRDRAIGTAEERAVERVCREAVDEVVRKLSGECSEIEIVHVLGLLDDALATRTDLMIPVAESLAEGGGPDVWRRAFDDFGYASETLPMAFGAFVEELLTVLPARLRAAAARHDSPLFERIAVTDLGWLRQDATDLRAALVRRIVAPAVPLAAELEAALDSSYAACRATKTKYYTPHLLLALLDLRDGVVRMCFERVEGGLAADIRTRLAAYVSNAGHATPEPFAEFRWVERDDIGCAQRLAAEAGSPVVTSPLLLAAVLETPSGTQQQLLQLLGPQRFEELRARALAADSVAAPAVTPGNIFGER
jgi:Clp amino terminal domain, pathogenicity island component